MTSRAEITSKYAKAYRAASKKERGRLLDEVVAVTGWSRDNARRRLAAAAKLDPGKGRDVAVVARRRRPNNHLVRRYGFYYRYDSPAELRVLNRLWPLVNDRLTYFIPTKKPIGWDADRNGRRRRIHDEQQMPIKLAKDKTDQLREATARSAKKPPATSRGVRLRETS